MSEDNEMNIENENLESSGTMEPEPNLTTQDSMDKDDETQDSIISTDLDSVSEQDNFYEEYSNTILTTLKNLRETMDKVYQMRMKAAELDLELNTIYNPNLVKKIEDAHQQNKKCKN